MTSKTESDLPIMMQGFAALNPEAAVKSLNLLSSGVQFLSMRMDSSFAAQRALLACSTPAEVFEVQSDYIKTAIEQYKMATQGMMEALGPQKSVKTTGTKRAFDDVPL